MRLGRPSPVAVATHIRLKRSQHPGPFLIVEGPDDSVFCKRYKHDRCSVVVAWGKEEVLEVIRILENDGFQGALGLVDPDFDVLEGVEISSRNVVTWDAHDLEVALICSPAFDRLLLAYGSGEKIRSLGVEARDLVLSAAAAVGYLRWASLRKGLNVRFQGLKLTQCIDRDSLRIDPVQLCQTVINLSQRLEMDAHELAETARSLKDSGHDMGHVCCGDDAVQILSIGLRKVLGTNKAQCVSMERLKQSLRLAFEDVDFRSSTVGASIKEWESRNPEYSVLKTRNNNAPD